ncbi:uncharacterized protein BDZ99DRAFT_476111 [Mytilinidion resinicola]|uniref:Uncharacterized protein n=1 Tax=Mytilinidion resinicola TaxID=574789 RepID=A0A6A6YPC1_9PEZI|nr:uncharacterized protein BDZ99DRAFT_476111 [Mytilinidion resinicola]KAF2809864.1 hypothetical protein BDZ99DRAFT_476111 [Mytilinidion resinicola]
MEHCHRTGWDWAKIVSADCECGLLRKLPMYPELVVLPGLMTVSKIILVALNVWDAYRIDEPTHAVGHYFQEKEAHEGHDTEDSDEDFDIKSLPSEIRELEDDDDASSVKSMSSNIQKHQYKLSTLEYATDDSEIAGRDDNADLEKAMRAASFNADGEEIAKLVQEDDDRGNVEHSKEAHEAKA